MNGRKRWRCGLIAACWAWCAGGWGWADGERARAEEAQLAGVAPSLRLSWENELLTIRGAQLPGGSVQVWYIEAFCRAGSAERRWEETVIPHHSELISVSDDERQLQLVSRLEDGVEVVHRIAASADEVDFRISAHNPTQRDSEVHWGQPCVRVHRFTERRQQDYISRLFVFLEGELTPLPTQPWAERARYVPGQVWRAPGVDPADVNPRPLSRLVPSPGLIGCFSADGKQILATAWEPYQELFQGVVVCLHADFRLGGISAGETKQARGKLYFLPADVALLLKRYGEDFPRAAAAAGLGGKRASAGGAAP